MQSVTYVISLINMSMRLMHRFHQDWKGERAAGRRTGRSVARRVRERWWGKRDREREGERGDGCSTTAIVMITIDTPRASILTHPETSAESILSVATAGYTFVQLINRQIFISKRPNTYQDPNCFHLNHSVWTWGTNTPGHEALNLCEIFDFWERRRRI